MICCPATNTVYHCDGCACVCSESMPSDRVTCQLIYNGLTKPPHNCSTELFQSIKCYWYWLRWIRNCVCVTVFVPACRLLGGHSLRGPDGPGCWGWTGWHSVTGKGCSPLKHAHAHTHMQCQHYHNPQISTWCFDSILKEIAGEMKSGWRQERTGSECRVNAWKEKKSMLSHGRANVMLCLCQCRPTLRLRHSPLKTRINNDQISSS